MLVKLNKYLFYNVETHPLRLMMAYLGIMGLVICLFIPSIKEITEAFAIENKLNKMEMGFAFVFTAVILAPLLEETIFRLPLENKVSYFLISLFVAIILIFSLKEIIAQIAIIITSTIYLIRVFKPQFLDSFHLRNFIIAFLFAIVHSTNYEYEQTEMFLLILPVITIPQLMLGYFCGYMRRFNFGYSLLFHGCYNSLVFLMAYLFN